MPSYSSGTSKTGISIWCRRQHKVTDLGRVQGKKSNYPQVINYYSFDRHNHNSANDIHTRNSIECAIVVEVREGCSCSAIRVYMLVQRIGVLGVC